MMRWDTDSPHRRRVIVADPWTAAVARRLKAMGPLLAPWTMSRRRLIETVQRDSRIIGDLGDEIVRMSACHDGLHRKVAELTRENQRLRSRLAEVSS